MGIVLCGPTLLAGTLQSGLTPAELSEVQSGHQVVHSKEVDGCPWPQITIFQKVQAEPEEVAAVFFDFEGSKRFIPNVLEAEISRTVSPRILEVNYAIDIPIFPDEYYTVRNTLTRAASDGYAISWKLLKARQTKDSVGSFHVEPLGGGTLMRYRNLVTPGSAMAGLLRGVARGQMEDAASAIAGRTESLKKSNPAALKSKVQKLHAALGE